MSARWTLAAFMLLAGMGVGAAAEPIDCAGMPVALREVEDASCSIETRFDFDAFHANSHDKRFSSPPSIIPGVDARGVIHELRGFGPDGETLYAALARADDRTHIRFMIDLERWASSGWLPWRRGADRDWSTTRVLQTADSKWYYARFSWEERRCLVILSYHALHENSFRFAVIAATCRTGVTYGEAEAKRLAASVLIRKPLVN